MSTPPPATSSLYTFDIHYVETLLAKKDWNACWNYFASILKNLGADGGDMSLQKDFDEKKQKDYINDFGSLLGELLLSLLSNESVNISDAVFQKLIFLHEPMHTLFYMYDLDDTDAIIEAMLAGKKRLSALEQKRLLLILSLNTRLDLKSIFDRVDRDYRIPAVVSFFAYRKIFRERVYKNKVSLYSYRQDLEKTYTEHDTLFQSTAAFFLCSYINIPNKHIIKENINIACQKFVDSYRKIRRIKGQDFDRTQFQLDDSKPTVVVVAEYFSKDHAMYRCWGQRTGAIKSEFNVIFTMPADCADARLKTDYENYQPFEHIAGLLQLIHDVKPDIIFMPSVGMRFYNVLVAALRLAPVQIMGLGHPATSMSRNIDFVMGPGSIYDERAFPTDTYIADGYPGTYIPLLSKEKFFKNDQVEIADAEKKEIRIAIVGTSVKVSYPFFELLKEIVQESPFKIHVSFLMGIAGIDSFYIEKYLKENFASSTYYGLQPYESYLETIRSVDIVLNPFPFGHTNTVIDTLMCGKPCVGLEGVEPASKSESDVLQTVGLKGDFIAQSNEEYKEKFFALSKRILAGERIFFDKEKVYERLFVQPEDYDYGKIMKWVYENRAALKGSSKKHFTAFEALSDQ